MSSPPKLAMELALPANAAGAAQAAELIRAGKLVILPTETVYGIAVNLHSVDTRQAARALRTRALDGNAAIGPWVIHTPNVEDTLTWMPGISSLGRRLVTKSLPGPVAFQVKLSAADQAAARHRLGSAADETLQDGFLTLRCPDFSLTQEILATVKKPVAIIGAGTPAQPGVYEPADVPPSLLAESQVSGVLEGGPTRYRRSSTLVRIEGEQYSVLRAGVIDERIIERMADFTLLFLCSGNTCRSPMAAAIASGLLAQKLGVKPADLPLRHVVVQSAGLHASRGMRAAREGVDAVQSIAERNNVEMGALARHSSQAATPELLRRADVIYTMTAAHTAEVVELYPWAERKTFELDPNADIADPIGSPLSVYERVAKRILELLQKRLSELPL